MSVIITIRKQSKNSWYINNYGYRALIPLFEEELEGDQEALDAIETGYNYSAIMLNYIAEKENNVDLAIRLAKAIRNVAALVANGTEIIYESQTSDENQNTRIRFSELVELMEEFLEEHDK